MTARFNFMHFMPYVHLPKPAKPEPNRKKRRRGHTTPSAFRAFFGCSADSHPPKWFPRMRVQVNEPNGFKPLRQF